MDLETIRKSARVFIESALSKEETFPFNFKEKGRMDKTQLQLWLRAILQEMAVRLRASADKHHVPIRVMEKWSENIRRAMVGSEYFNQSPPALLENLYYRIRDAE